MKTIIDTQTLRSATDTAASVIPRNTTLPGLEHLRISCNGKLEMSGTDRDTSVRISVPLVECNKRVTDKKTDQFIVNETIHDGSVLVNAELFRKCVDSLPPDEITLSYNAPGFARQDNKLQMQLGSRIVASMAIDPNLAKVTELLAFRYEPLTGENSIKFSIELPVLQMIAAKCAPFCSDDSLRPVSQGILFQYEKSIADDAGTLTCVASTGHILALLRMPLLAAEDFAVIIPAVLLRRVAQLMRGPVTVRFHKESKEPHIEFVSTGDDIDTSAGMLPGATVTVAGRTIAERFFNYNAVQPQERTHFVTIKKEGMLRSIARLALFSGGQVPRVTLTGTECDRIRISAEDFDRNSGEETIPCLFNAESEPLLFAANAKLLGTVLNALQNEDAMIRFAGTNRAATFEEEFKLPLTNEKDGPQLDVYALYLLMPLRIDSEEMQVRKNALHGTALAAATEPA